MKNLFRDDKTLFVEMLSACAFFVMSLILTFSMVSSPDNNHSYFWVSILSIFAFLQYISIKFKYDLMLLRICMAWVAGTTWTWLAYVSSHTVLFAPALLIGLFNLYAFTILTNRASFDWRKFFQE